MSFGRRAFIAGAAGAAGAVAASAVSSVAQAAGVPAGASYFEAVSPVRLADTRTYAPYTAVAKNFQRLSDRSIRIPITGSAEFTAPTGVVAVVVSIAAIYNGSRGWVAATPTGSSKVVSNINMSDGDNAVANLATVKIGAGGQIDIKSLHPCDVVVDIVGVYRSTSTKVRAGRLQFLPATRRALSDTRMQSNTWRTVQLPFLSQNAAAVVVNLTVARCRTRGFLTAAAVRTPTTPTVSNLNYNVGESRAVGAIVKLGLTGSTPSIELYSRGDVQVFVDVTGYITGEGHRTDSDGLFVPIEPNRVMDTRRAADFASSGKKRLWQGWTRPFQLPNNTAGFGPRTNMKGVAMNATLVTAMQRGFLTVLPARTVRQFVSNLNATRVGHVVANHVITEVSQNGVELFANCGGDVLADVAGWYVGAPRPPAYSSAPFDPPAPTAPFNWVLNVPRMNLVNWVIPNIYSGDPVVDGGDSWHWTNTGLIGAAGASIVVFGHRTSKGGPYRTQHYLVSGDRLYVTTPDSRRYEYRFVGEQLTDHTASQILNAARSNSAGTTFTLVSCTGRGVPGAPGVKNDLPSGGIAWRLVSTFVLVGWTDERPHSG